MTEAVRDVVMRVSLRPGERMDLPDWVKATGSAAQYFRGVEEGYRKLVQASEQTTAKIKEQQTATEGVTEAVSQEADEVSAEMNRITEGVNKAIDAFDGIAQSAESLEDVKRAVEAYASEIQAALNLDPDQFAQVQRALLEEGERLFTESQGRIVDAERAATAQRLAERERLKEAQKKASLQFQNLWMEAFQKVTLASTHFASIIQQSKLLGNDKQNIEELARAFVEVNASIQMIHHGAEGMKQLSRAMTELQRAGQLAQASLAATGASATFAQGAMIRLAPAAAAAHAALGPISLVMGAIAVAAVGVQAATSFFGEKLPTETELAEKALERYNDQLRFTQERLSVVSSELERQTQAMRAQFEVQKMQQGGAVTPEQMREQFVAGHGAIVQANRHRLEQAGATAEGTLTEEQRKQLVDAQRAAQAAEAEYARIRALPRMTRERGENLLSSETTMQNTQTALNQLRERLGINNLDRIRTARESDPERLSEMIKVLPDAMKQAFLEAIAANQQEQFRFHADAAREFEQGSKSREGEMTDLDRKMQDADKAFREEQDRARKLQELQRTGGMGDIMSQVQGGSLLQGIDALSPFISSDRQQALRNREADNTLSVQDLLAELADAQEFETERQQMDQLLKVLQDQRDALKEQRDAMVTMQQDVLDEMKQTSDQMKKVLQSNK